VASFAYHLGLSAAAGVGAGVAANRMLSIGWEESVCIGILVLGSGFICDLDSADSHHTHHALNIASAVAPALLLTAAGSWALSSTVIFLSASLSYLLTRVLLREVVRHISAPRGMFHSVPAAIVWACMVFLAFHDLPQNTRLLFAGASAGGYLLHLVLDASFSKVSISGAGFDPGQHSGFALKLYSSSMFANFICYGLLITLCFLCLRTLGFIDL